MALHFEAIALENRRQLEELELFPEQSGYIESVKECLFEADADKKWRPVGIYNDQTLIGFAMYACFQEPSAGSQVWLDRLLIDKNHQGKGYGKAAVVALIDRLSKEYNCRRIYLSVYANNQAAIHLYKEIGFYFNGEHDVNGEDVMVYRLDDQATRR